MRALMKARSILWIPNDPGSAFHNYDIPTNDFAAVELSIRPARIPLQTAANGSKYSDKHNVFNISSKGNDRIHYECTVSISRLFFPELPESISFEKLLALLWLGPIYLGPICIEPNIAETSFVNSAGVCRMQVRNHPLLGRQRRGASSNQRISR